MMTRFIKSKSDIEAVNTARMILHSLEVPIRRRIDMLCCAVDRGWLRCLELLLKEGVDPSRPSAGRGSLTPYDMALDRAVFRSSPEVLGTLVKHSPPYHPCIFF